MMKPTVHLNGTSAAELAEGYQTAAAGVQAAIEALQASAPNARDYYVQGAGAFEAAVREHEARMHRLADVARELLDLFEVTYEAAAEQAERRGRPLVLGGRS